MRVNWAAVALAVPSTALCGWLSVVIGLSAAGRHPFWPEQHVNVSEAVAANDDATLLQLMAGGADLNIVYGVRPGLLSDSPARATPLEASVLARRIDLFERLLERGATLDAPLWARLRCLTDDPQTLAALEKHRPAGAVSACRS